MDFNDFKNYIKDFIIYSDQNPEDWDIEGAARELYDMCPEPENIDDVDEDTFITVLQKHEA